MVPRLPGGSEPASQRPLTNAERLAVRNHRRRTVVIEHHFTVDVEEYFQVSAFERQIPRESWREFPSRVQSSMEKILELMAAHGARGTFFILGHIAVNHPQIVRMIAEAGHEIASHGWDHRKVTDLEPTEFRHSIRRTKQLLEDISGLPVLGFRAPSFSITRGREWALDILLEEGYAYDSSLFPVKRPGYGFAAGERDPHYLQVKGGRLWQVPPTTLRRLGANLPAAGGAYLRIFPFSLVRTAFREAERRGMPGTFYIHPWEVDPEQPRLPASLSTRFRHYTGLRKTLPRIARLLSEFRFTSIAHQYRMTGYTEAA